MGADKNCAEARAFRAMLDRVRTATGAQTLPEIADLFHIRISSLDNARDDAERSGHYWRIALPRWSIQLYLGRGINPLWVTKGEGPMHLWLNRHDEKAAPATRRPRNNTPPQERPLLVPVCGPAPEDFAEGASPVGWIALSKAHIRPGVKVLRCDSDDFAPVVRQGAHVGIDTNRTCPTSGNVFALRLSAGNSTLRRIFHDEDRNRFLLRTPRSESPEEISPEDLAAGMLGRVVWVLQAL